MYDTCLTKYAPDLRGRILCMQGTQNAPRESILCMEHFVALQGSKSNQLITHLNVSATSINSGGKSPSTIGDNPGPNHFGILVTIMAVINTTSDCFTTPIFKVHFLFRILRLLNKMDNSWGFRRNHSIAKKPYIFVNVQGGGGVRTPCPPPPPLDSPMSSTSILCVCEQRRLW